MKTDDGGPAFPVLFKMSDTGPVQVGHDGMSLRDYFAGKVAGFLIWTRPAENSTYGMASVEDVAARAYAIADAMLKERSGPRE